MSRKIMRRVSERWKHIAHFFSRRKSGSYEHLEARNLWRNNPMALKGVRDVIADQIRWKDPELLGNVRESARAAKLNNDPLRRASLEDARDYYRVKLLYNVASLSRPFAANATIQLLNLSRSLSSVQLTKLISTISHSSFPEFNLSQSLAKQPPSKVEAALTYLRPFLGSHSRAFLSDYLRVMKNVVDDFAKNAPTL